MTASRSTLYGCIALGFQKPSVESLVRLTEGLAAIRSTWQGEQIGITTSTATQLERVEHLVHQNLDAGTLLELEWAYNRLFVGPGRPLAHPYESVYQGGLLMGEPAIRTSRLYAEVGFVPWPETKDLPDHVAAQLGYMAFLAADEERARHEGDISRAEENRCRQKCFLADHLGSWLPLFFDRVLAAEEHPFYTTLARLAKDYVGDDLRSLVSPEERSHRAAPTRTRHPNIQILVDRRLCTLCGICAEVCPTHALHLDAPDGQAALSFDRAGCNGCRRCPRYCPEQAITIEKGPPLADPLPGQRYTLTSSPRVVCPVCGDPHVTQVWLQRVIDRVGRRDERFMRALQLCPACRTVVSQCH